MRDRSVWCLALLVLIVNVILLLPVLDSPYLGDDSWCESTIRGTALLSGKDLSTICWNTVKDYVRSGRWYPAIIYYYPVFYYTGRFTYKVVGLCFVVLNVMLFGYFVYLLTRSRWAALASMLLVPLSFQLRFYHDPIMSYYYLMQVELSLILVSLILLIRYLRSHRSLFLWSSVAAYTVCLLVYEAFYGIWVIHALLAYVYLRKESIARASKVAAPFLATAIVNAGLTILIRSLYAARYEGITLNVSPTDWFWAFLKQSFAALPLSYVMTSSAIDRSFLYAREHLAGDLFVVCALWLLAWVMVWEYARTDKQIGSSRGAGTAALVGVALWLLPATLVSLSSKYQHELTWGLGYLPVYVSGFGITLIVVSILLWLRRPSSRGQVRSGLAAAILVGAAGTVVCGITYNTNRMVVQRYGYVEYYQRALIENAMHCGLFQPVPDGSILVCDLPIRSWDSPSFFRMHSGLTLDVVRPTGFAPDVHLANSTVSDVFGAGRAKGLDGVYECSRNPSNVPKPPRYAVEWQGAEGPILKKSAEARSTYRNRPAFFLRYQAQSEGIGYAVLARIVDLAADNAQFHGVTADRVFLYIGAPFGYPGADVVVSGVTMSHGGLKHGTGFQLTERDLKLLSSDRRGRVFEIPPPGGGKLFDAKSIAAVVSTARSTASSFPAILRAAPASTPDKN